MEQTEQQSWTWLAWWLHALPQPQSDRPGIANYHAWQVAQPKPAPEPQPEPKRCDGLLTQAPLSGRVGGKWGVEA
jgi:TorA maturation chaperone TorD